MKVVENLFKKKLMVKNSFIEKTNVVGTHWNRGNSDVYLRHMLLKIRKKTIWKFTFYVTENKEENYLEFYILKYHVHCLYLF